MPTDESQALVQPYWVQYHTVLEDGVTQKAYPFLVVHEGPSDSGADQKWGWVLANDEDSGAGLAQGLNWRADIGHGGPGASASWSNF